LECKIEFRSIVDSEDGDWVSYFIQYPDGLKSYVSDLKKVLSTYNTAVIPKLQLIKEYSETIHKLVDLAKQINTPISLLNLADSKESLDDMLIPKIKTGKVLIVKDLKEKIIIEYDIVESSLLHYELVKTISNE
jgi:hypothetical protein